MTVFQTCCLYRYQPADLVRLAPVLGPPDQLWRIRAQLAHRLDTRFPRAQLLAGDHGSGRTRPPSAHDRQLVRDALTIFTPWGAVHTPPPAPDRSLLDGHFAPASRCSDEDNARFPPRSARRLAGPSFAPSVGHSRAGDA
jgi:hypothetical protein